MWEQDVVSQNTEIHQEKNVVLNILYEVVSNAVRIYRETSFFKELNEVS